MKTYIKYSKSGEILSVCRTDFVSPYVATPFGILGPGEAMLEVAERDATNKLSSEQIHDSYSVVVDKGKLIKKR